MKRLAALLLALFVIGSTPAYGFSPAHRLRGCRYATAGHAPDGAWTRWRVTATLACAAKHYAVPGGYGYLYAVADRESHLHADAVNASGHCGLFQHGRQYWGGRVREYNAHVGRRLRVAPDCLNARSNALVSAWMMATGRLYPWR